MTHWSEKFEDPRDSGIVEYLVVLAALIFFATAVFPSVAQVFIAAAHAKLSLE